MPYETVHETHPDIVKRLRRAEGHLRSIVDMIASGRSCLEIAQQLHAVKKARATATRTLIHDHLDHGLEAAAGPATRGQRSQLGACKDMTTYLCARPLRTRTADDVETSIGMARPRQ
jgi:uncharacterized protein